MSETFAANLRAEMYRQGLSHLTLAYKTDSYSYFTDRIYSWAYRPGSIEDPTPSEITSLAAALSVPESRLLVGRDELEKEVADLKEEIRLLKIEAEVYTLVDWDLLMEDLEPTDLPNHRLVFGGGMGDKGTLSFQRSDQGLEIWIENYGDGLTYTMHEGEEAGLIAYLLG